MLAPALPRSLTCFASPGLFARAFLPDFQQPAHVKAFERATLRLLASDTFHRQIIEAPVRHGKSYWHSIVVPSWHSCAFPAKKVLGVSYGKELSEEFSADVVHLCEEAGQRLGLRMAWKRRGSFRWADFGGGYDSTTAQGAVTGKGYHLICADDLVKDDAEARSPVERARLSKWWQFDCCTRCEPGGKVSLVMSRRHTSDLSGECLAANKDLPESKRWESIQFKAIDANGRALWPERFNLQALQDIFTEWELKGRSYMFDTLYQQNPRGDPGACAWKDSYFQDIFRNVPPTWGEHMHVLACDPSHGANSSPGDYTAIADMRLVNGPEKVLFADMYMRQLDWSEAAAVFAEQIIARRPRAAMIEVAAGQDPIRAEVQRRLDAANCLVPLYGFDPMGATKIPAIEEALTQWLHLHRIFFVDNLGGQLCVAQMKEFPSGAHDDGPDALRIGLSLIAELLG